MFDGYHSWYYPTIWSRVQFTFWWDAAQVNDDGGDDDGDGDGDDDDDDDGACNLLLLGLLMSELALSSPSSLAMSPSTLSVSHITRVTHWGAEWNSIWP